ncbi:DUF2612 domain-containing protein [Novosphingobium fuchskuhlense]|uniref:DUF2612 domain-containing protein n=1 Tax=Novosphingobium fuchskuhlense TaxID=1117702 RepID=UPI000AFEB179|nr:DUF2612 domain-containing protein [Novosphingobium fuchskuhlense]
MIVPDALGSFPLGYGSPGDGAEPFFSIRDTVLSQYANSPILLAILDTMGTAIDRQAQLSGFRDWVWNVDTAQGFGLDLLGRIVGVARSLYISTADYLGFSDQPSAVPFGEGVFYSAQRLTPNYSVSDDAYRQMILAKAALNITNCSIPSVNAILRALFPSYGNVYVRDNADMTMTYVFSAAPSKVDYAIVTQSGALPKPAGVAVTVETP